MTIVVVDASAVVAVIREERGALFISKQINKAVISTVNLQEVVKILLTHKFPMNILQDMIEALQLDIRPHTVEDAYAAATLFQATKVYGCGLGDRTCMALAIKQKVPVITTDQSWAKLDIEGLKVILAR
jgi:ribonuclease VapC